MQKLMGLVRRCVDDYDMIQEGDRIAVGVSGGKDSLVLLTLLAGLRAYFNKPFELEALTIDMGLGMDYSGVEALCRDIGVPYSIVKTEIAPINFDHRQEKNPCTKCAKMPRGALNPAILEPGYNTLALRPLRERLPLFQTRCPVDQQTLREEVKQRIYQLSQTYPDLKERIFGAMQRFPLPAWEPHGRYKRPKEQE